MTFFQPLHLKEQLRTNQISNLRTKRERNDFLQMSLPQSLENQRKWDIHDPRAQKYHKSIFDNFIILDNQPFNIVNKPGFLRHMATMDKRFELASDKYYRYIQIIFFLNL